MRLSGIGTSFRNIMLSQIINTGCFVHRSVLAALLPIPATKSLVGTG